MTSPELACTGEASSVEVDTAGLPSSNSPVPTVSDEAGVSLLDPAAEEAAILGAIAPFDASAIVFSDDLPPSPFVTPGAKLLDPSYLKHDPHYRERHWYQDYLK